MAYFSNLKYNQIIKFITFMLHDKHRYNLRYISYKNSFFRKNVLKPVAMKSIDQWFTADLLFSYITIIRIGVEICRR